MSEINYQLNERLYEITPSPIREFNEKISGIEGLIRLTIGEPDFPTPQFIKDAAVESIQNSFNGYSHSRGMLELRQEISGYLKRHYGLEYDPKTEIVVTIGGTEANFSALYTLVNPGDKVATAAPYYAVYKSQVGLVGGEFIPIDVTEDGLKLTPEKLQEVLTEHPDLKVLLLNLPSNPTGKSYSRQDLEALAKVIVEHDLLVISDEIYSGLTYGHKHVSMAEILPERTLLVNGASKSHSMTGWRMGFVCGPEEIITHLFKIHQGTVNAPSTQAQFGGIAAYSERGDIEIERMRKEYENRRDYSLERLRAMGFEVETPEGAFYVFPKVPDWYDGDDYQFCLDVANEAKVGLVPGVSFGEAGKGYFRISYAASMEKLEEAYNRIEEFVNKNK